MTEDMTIRKKEGLWVVRAGGAVLGESKRVLELSEGTLPPVIYFPREDLAMAMLDPSPTRISSPNKGEAVHYSIVAKSGTITDAAWSYEAPHAAAADIAGHIAFYGDKATVEEI